MPRKIFFSMAQSFIEVQGLWLKLENPFPKKIGVVEMVEVAKFVDEDIAGKLCG